MITPLWVLHPLNTIGHFDSQQVPNEELVVSYTPMPNYALVSIHLPIIPILLSLLC